MLCAASPTRKTRPSLDVLDLDRQPGRAERFSDEFDAALLGGVGPQVGRSSSIDVDDRVDDQEAGVARFREPEEALEARAEDVDHAQVAIA
jgi:hypothetical protein